MKRIERAYFDCTHCISIATLYLKYLVICINIGNLIVPYTVFEHVRGCF